MQIKAPENGGYFLWQWWWGAPYQRDVDNRIIGTVLGGELMTKRMVFSRGMKLAAIRRMMPVRM
jgi:hypothetical protein